MSSQSVVVVGAGAVGLCTALALLEDGHQVTLVDRAEPGSETSSGNAGIISVQSVTPINSPKVLKDLPQLLFASNSVLRLRWRDLPWTAPWLLAFARNCLPAASERSRRGQAALARASADAWRVLLQRHGGNERVTWPGWLKLAETDAEAASAAAERRVLEAFEHEVDWLDGDGVADLEPGLAPRFKAGLWLKGNGLVDRPGALLQHFAERFTAVGGVLRRDEVGDVRDVGDAVEVAGASGTLRADAAVLAAGPWSARLGRGLGCRLRLVAERGYHLMLPQTTMPIGRALIAVGRGFVLAPMGDSLRLTHGAEIARNDTAPDERRIRATLGELRRWLPDASVEVESSWMGRRPSTADSLPIIARAPASARVILAYGHGHLGLTMGPITGRLVADLVVGRPPALDLSAYAAAR